MSGEPWFAPKRYGFGAGWPINRKGWLALLAFFVFAAIGSAALAAADVPHGWRTTFFLILSVAFVWFCKTKTAGDWRWRWGEDE
jgi:uncharacterized membrane protein YhaH (DUF805 family)